MSTPINDTRTKERIKISNEIFTPPESVEEILDGIEEINPELFSDWKTTILEPTCGNGRFITAIIRRRWKYKEDNVASFYPLAMIKTIYAFDIHASNIVETREEIIKTIYRISKEESKDHYARQRTRDSIMKILQKNIVCGDSAKILDDSNLHSRYDFNIEQPNPYEFNIEDKIEEEYIKHFFS